MKTKTLVLSLLYAIPLYFFGVAIGEIWYSHVTNGMHFHRYLGFIDTGYLFGFVPLLFLYLTVGYFFVRLFNIEALKDVLIFCGIILALQTLLISHGFTENADLIDKAWAYLSYLVPSLSVLIGFQLKQLQKNAFEEYLE